jgi:hypothetical protein
MLFSVFFSPREKFYLRNILRVIKSIEIYEYACVSREFWSEAKQMLKYDGNLCEIKEVAF